MSWILLNTNSVMPHCSNGICKRRAWAVSHAAGAYYLCESCYTTQILKPKKEEEGKR